MTYSFDLSRFELEELEFVLDENQGKDFFMEWFTKLNL